MVSVRYTFSSNAFKDRYQADDPPELYAVLNSEMRLASRVDAVMRAEIIEAWAPLVKHLLGAMSKLPRHCGLLFRVMRVVPDHIRKAYEKGRLVRWGAFSSLGRQKLHR